MTRMIVFALLSVAVTAEAADSAPGKVGAYFEQNIGQAQADTAYVARGVGQTLLFGAGGAVVERQNAGFKITLLGANSQVQPIGVEQLPGVVNYMVGSDPAGWTLNIPTFAAIEYRDVYPGVNLVYRAQGSQLQYEFELKPGADPSCIRWKLDTTDSLQLDATGELRLQTARATVRHGRPQLYQVERGIRRKISGKFSTRGRDVVAFDFGSYNRSLPLVILSSVIYGSYLGGTGNDAVTSVAVDSYGSAYVAGWTESSDLPGGRTLKSGVGGGVDVFVGKLNAAGTSLVYMTYLGGRNDDRAFGIAVDSSGSATIAGWTYSSDFPVVNAAQSALAGGRNGFVAKLNSAGNALTYSTYLGGRGYDTCAGVALDGTGNAYVAGSTNSDNFPTLNGFQSRAAGGDDAFIAKFNSAGARIYTTYIGGTGDDHATAIAVDSNGSAYITGNTYSVNFPVVSAFQAQIGGGEDAFIAKLNPAGNSLFYSTYLGGNSGSATIPETGTGIVVDGSGSAYVTGTTGSPNFPLINPFQPVIAGIQDGFVSKLSAAGNALVYSTYLGGHGADTPTGITLDSSGNAYVTGYTAATDFPVASALQFTNAGGYDAFVAKLNATGSTPVFATYLGGTGSDAASAIALDSANGIYVVGQTQSPDFPATTLQKNKFGVMNAFIAKLSSDPTLTISGRVTMAGTGSPIGGVTVILSGTSNSTTTTDSSGNYAFIGLRRAVNYVVTPSLGGFVFNPVNQAVNSNNPGEVVNFTGTGSASNLALGKIATQSSTLVYFASTSAKNAVDGVTDGNFANGYGSVTHTDANFAAWWQVDLGASANLSSIAIWNRTDCCGARLSDYWVFASDTPFGDQDTPATLQYRSGTWSNHQTSTPNPTTTIAVSGVTGRYVRIQLAGMNYLSLAEVQVFGSWVSGPPPTGTNLALGRPASQSSTNTYFASSGPGNAVDGNTNGDFANGNGSVTHTNLDSNPWWQVDLGASANVGYVTIWNRTDCCGARLSDYWVFVSDTPFNPTDTPANLQSRSGTWSSHQTTTPNASITISTPGVTGRYVRVQLSAANYLSLAEVQVFGSWLSGAPPTLTNIALGRPASQSSTNTYFPSTAAANAVDSNTDGNFSNGSVTHTDLDTNAWWQVDLGSSVTVSSVVIWNRTDCCNTRLSDYWVFVSDTPFNGTDTPGTLQIRVGTWGSHQTNYPSPSTTISTGNVKGRYVRVQISGTNYLSLAEVQVLGY